jgi:hypothetical protein
MHTNEHAPLTHIYTYTYLLTHTHTHTHSLSLSLSLSHTHTHAHTHLGTPTQSSEIIRSLSDTNSFNLPPLFDATGGNLGTHAASSVL